MSIETITGVSRYSIGRHVAAGHVPPKLDATTSSAPVAVVVAADLDPLTELRAQLAALNAMDTSKMSPNQQMQLAESKRRATEALAKALPAAPPPPTGNPGLPEYLRSVDQILAKYGTEALEAHINAQRALRGMGPTPYVPADLDIKQLLKLEES